MNEPVVLVGETGAGKTATIQYLAQTLNKTLKISNLSRGTDSADLFGGFKPMNLGSFFKLLLDDFSLILENLFNASKNLDFFANAANLYLEKKFSSLSKLILKSVLQIRNSSKIQSNVNFWKFEETLTSILNRASWFLENASNQSSEGAMFDFCKGILWKALERGDWILLDEINLGQNDVLERLEQVLKNEEIFLLDSNQVRMVRKHPDFRLFAAMNPAYEAGKKPLPKKLQKLFVKIEFQPIRRKEEVAQIIKRYFSKHPRVNHESILNIAELFCQLKVNIIIYLLYLFTLSNYINIIISLISTSMGLIIHCRLNMIIISII